MKRKKSSMNVGYVLKTVLSTFSVLFLVGLLFSCKEDYAYVTPTYVSTAYDSSKPVEITAILPDSGGYKTPFVIKGSNFGNDLSKIKVIFNGDREAVLVSTNGETLYGIMPKQEDGFNEVVVTVDGKESKSPQTFRYVKVEQVSTVAGKSGVGGYTDGTLIDSRFGKISGIASVVGNNLIVCEGNDGRVRMVSIDDNKVSTLFSGFKLGQPAVTKDRTRVYVIQTVSPHAIYYFARENSWTSKRLTSGIANVTGQIHSCALDNDEKYLYFRDHNGKFGRVEIANPQNVEILNSNCGKVDKETSYLAFNPVENCFYLSLQNAQGIYKVSHDGQTVEDYAGFNSIGGKDGPRLEATLRNPAGITFDKSGNLYFCDSQGYTLRKISRIDGMLTTVAGQYQKSGGVDGLPLESTFNYPYVVCMDDEENFFIGERWGCVVRKFAVE